MQTQLGLGGLSPGVASACPLLARLRRPFRTSLYNVLLLHESCVAVDTLCERGVRTTSRRPRRSLMGNLLLRTLLACELGNGRTHTSSYFCAGELRLSAMWRAI